MSTTPLRFALRWLASMLAFVLFGLGGIVVGVLILPLLSLVIRDRDRRIRGLRNVVQRMFQLYMNILTGLGAASFEIEGEPAPGGGHLIVANHPTLIDAVILLGVFPQCDCIIKHQLLRNPFTRFALGGLDYISNADTGQMLDTAVARLKDGANLLVFPEGTRSTPGEPLHFYLAAAAMAVRAGAPCQPVIIRCEPITTAKGTPFYRIAPERPHFRAIIDPPLDVTAIVQGLNQRQAKRALNDFLLSYYNQRLTNFAPTQSDQRQRDRGCRPMA